MKRSFFAALALGWSLLALPGAPAHAQGCGQGNPNCVAPTPPLGNNTNRIATTAFVQGTLAGGLPLTQSSIFIGNGSNFAQGSPVTGDCVFTFLAGNALARCIGTSSNGQLLRNNAGVIAGLTAGALTRTDDTNVTLTLGGTPASALVNAASITVGWTGTLAAPRGGTGFGSYTIGDLLYADTANSLAKLPDIATGNVLLSGGVGAPPSWGKVTASSITAAALTKADDTNVTLTLGGSPSLALVNAASITAGWTGTLAAPRGGTGFGSYAVGDLLYADTTTSLAKLADIAVGNVLLSGGVGVAPAWGKVTAASITAAALTKADDTNVTLTLGGAPTTALVNAASITAGWTGQLGLTRGGSAASLTASNGGIVYSTASAMAILAGTATARLPLLSGASTTPQWGAYTLPASVTSGGIPYFSSTSAESSSALLAQNGVMVGGGAGAAPATVTAGTNGQLLVGVTGSPPAMATMSADATIANTGAITFTTVNGNVGTFGSATQCVTVTNNAKGLTTAISAATCTPAIGSITGLGTNVATALAVNIGSAGAFVTFNGALGTPSSGTLTNATGLPVASGVSGLGTGVATLLGTAVSTAGGPTTTIAAGTSALGTSAIGSGSCATVVTTAATNTATTDVILAGFNGDPTAVTGYIPSTGGMLVIAPYPSANNVNFKVCNNTSSSITPGAITLNWRVVR